MNKGLISGLVLLVLGVVAGLILAVVNAITAPIIAQNELAAKLEALEVVFPGIRDQYDVTEIVLDGDIDTVYIVKDKSSGNPVGVVYSVSKMGYKTAVQMLISVNADGTVKDYAVIGTGGTEGIGLDLAATDFGMTGAPVGDETAFDAVAGATVSSGGVSACFEAVAARLATDLGGE